LVNPFSQGFYFIFVQHFLSIEKQLVFLYNYYDYVIFFTEVLKWLAIILLIALVHIPAPAVANAVSA